MLLTVWPHPQESANGVRHNEDLHRWLGLMNPVETSLKDTSNVQGWSPAYFEGDYRKKEAAIVFSALCLDYDGKSPVTISEAGELWGKYHGLIHSTKRHTDDKHRFRVVLELTEPLDAREFPRLWQWGNDTAYEAGHVIDQVACDVSRFWFLPCVLPGGEYTGLKLEGAKLDGRAILDSLPKTRRPRGIQAPPKPSTQRIESYARRSLDNAAAEIRGAPEGRRNDTTNRVAYTIGRLVEGGVIDEATATSELVAAAEATGLPASEARASVSSAIKGARKNPKHLPPPRPLPVSQSIRDAGLGGIVLQLGDHAEIARSIRDSFESKGPLTKADGRLWQYDDGRGIWAPLDQEHVMSVVATWSGVPIQSGDKTSPLRITDGVCRGVAAIVERDVAHRDDTGLPDTGHGVTFTNGYLGVDGVLQPWHKDQFSRHSHGFAYDPGAEAPLMHSVLSEIFADCTTDDRDARISLLQEFIGACLFGVATRYQKCILFVGGGANGKSQILDILRAALPEKTIIALAPHDWGDKFRTVVLRGALANVVDEMPDKDIVNGDAFKKVITGDPLTAERKFGDAFTFSPKCGHIFSGNKLPGGNDHSFGFYRRFIVIRLGRTFDSDKARLDIGKTVAELEAPGVVAWAVQGALRLMARGHYVEPPSAVEEKTAWVTENDSVTMWMTNECKINSDTTTSAQILYQAYNHWARAHGYVPVSLTTWGRRIKDAGVKWMKSSFVRYHLQLRPSL